jgi:hypothetical protein
MLIFVAGPYGDAKDYWTIEHNILRADRVARDIAALGHEPICPHNLTRHWELDKRLCKDDWIRIDNALLRKCDALFFIAWSPGTEAEVRLAQDLMLPIYYRLEEIYAARQE